MLLSPASEGKWKLLNLLIRGAASVGISISSFRTTKYINESQRKDNLALERLQFHTQIICLCFFVGIYMNTQSYGSLRLKIATRAFMFILWLINQVFMEADLPSLLSEVITLSLAFLLCIFIIILASLFQFTETNARLQTESLLRGMINHQNEIILLFDDKNLLVSWNLKAEKNFGSESLKDAKRLENSLLASKVKTIEFFPEMDGTTMKSTKLSTKNFAHLSSRTPRQEKTCNLLDVLSNFKKFDRISSIHYIELTKKLDYLSGNFSETFRNVETEAGDFLLNTEEKNDASPSKNHSKCKTFLLDIFPAGSLGLGPLAGFKVVSLNDMKSSRVFLKQKDLGKLKTNLLRSFSHEMHTALNGSLSLIDCAIEDPSVDELIKKKFFDGIKFMISLLYWT